MSKNTVTESTYAENEFKQQVISKQLILMQRVRAIHQQRIKVLQKEMVEISFQHGHWNKIAPLLAEIKKVRVLLSFNDERTESC